MSIWDDLQRDIVRSYTAKFMELLFGSDFNEIGCGLWLWQSLDGNHFSKQSNLFKLCVFTVCFELSVSIVRTFTVNSDSHKKGPRKLRTIKALLTRCYIQHALRPFIDSETNYKRHFIKNPFINKGIEFIGLPSIFKDRSVTSSISTYFQIFEPPIMCYEYNKPIRNTIFNFNKLTSMQTLLSHKIVKIPNLFILQPVI